jgi:hypothetical protein
MGFDHDEEPVCLFLDQRKTKAKSLDRFAHDYLHLYFLKSRYDLGTNFPTVPQPE